MRALLLLALALTPAFSATIVEYNGANTSTDAIFIGQSITTPTGGPWTNLTFNLYDINDAPSANGTLYLLTQAYAGAPNALSNATPGYLASTATINAGIWSFAPAVSINSSTQYFLYTDANNNILRANTTGTYPDGIAYYSFAANANFVTDPTSDTLFNLSGTPGATGVPEPASALILAAGLAALALVRRPARR
jgi:hypothetical protein